VLHRDAYQGGRYGEYGGYDLVLIRVTGEKLPRPACLPAQHSEPPTTAWIAGYGRYRRVPCETTARGPQVYEYCKLDPACRPDSPQYRLARCDVHFEWAGRNHTGCITSLNTPSSHNPACTAFRESTNITDKWMGRKGVDEVVLVSLDNNIRTACYRERAGRHGWCGTTHHLQPAEQPEPDRRVQHASGWGVCGDTCSEEYKAEARLAGRARVKQV